MREVMEEFLGADDDEAEDRECREQVESALYALVKRLGGEVHLPDGELPHRPYSIMRRMTVDGLDIKIVDDTVLS